MINELLKSQLFTNRYFYVVSFIPKLPKSKGIYAVTRRTGTWTRIPVTRTQKVRTQHGMSLS